MPVVDYERVVVKLEAYIASKPSHGQRDLFAKLSELKNLCMVPEGQVGFDPLPLPPRHPAEATSDGDLSTEDGATSHLAVAG